MIPVTRSPSPLIVARSASPKLTSSSTGNPYIDEQMRTGGFDGLLRISVPVPIRPKSPSILKANNLFSHLEGKK